jgi:hypothetical protein
MDPHRRAWIMEYGYGMADEGTLVACSNAHLINHSCEPNVLDHGLDFGVATSNIAADEEITIDYRTYVDDHAWSIDCACGADSCLREVSPEQGLSEHVVAGWRQQMEPALRRVGSVPQPCHSVLIGISPIYQVLHENQRGFTWQDYVSIRRPSFMVGQAGNIRASGDR